MSPRRRTGLSQAIQTTLSLPAGQLPEMLRHKFHRPSEAEMQRYHELENRRDGRARDLNIDPTLIASRATLGELARDWDKQAPELMNWQRELLL
jgi:ribonuclease D